MMRESRSAGRLLRGLRGTCLELAHDVLWRRQARFGVVADACLPGIPLAGGLDHAARRGANSVTEGRCICSGVSGWPAGPEQARRALTRLDHRAGEPGVVQGSGTPWATCAPGGLRRTRCSSVRPPRRGLACGTVLDHCGDRRPAVRRSLFRAVGGAALIAVPTGMTGFGCRRPWALVLAWEPLPPVREGPLGLSGRPGDTGEVRGTGPYLVTLSSPGLAVACRA
jgi:hypothetical protein